MTISKTRYRKLRIVGTAALWLGGWTAVYVAAAWAGAGYALTGFDTVMIAIFVGLVAVWVGCRAALFVADVRYDAADETAGPGADTEPTRPAAA